MSKYDPLTSYFRRLDSDVTEVTLAFDDIERIISAPLPHTARIDRPWWANTLRSNHGSKWLAAGWHVSGVDMAEGKVSFARGSTGRSPRRGGYARLTQFFRSMPDDQKQVALTYSEFEDILGRPLPQTAHHDEPWWANTRVSPQGSSWMSAGWRVEKVFFTPQIAVFRRTGHDLIRSIPRYIKAVLDGKGRHGRPTNEELRSWISFCRRNGWYFQAVVLYEKTGLDVESLREAERAEVQEDYEVCKRSLEQYRRNPLAT